MPLWEPAPDRGLGPSGHRLSSPAEWGRSAAIIQRYLWSMCCSLSPSPTDLSHITNINPFATLSRIKCETYIFLKKCVCSSLLLTMFLCIVVYVLCGYTTPMLKVFAPSFLCVLKSQTCDPRKTQLTLFVCFSLWTQIRKTWKGTLGRWKNWLYFPKLWSFRP